MHLRKLVVAASLSFFAFACGGALEEENLQQEPVQAVEEEANTVQAFGTCTVSCGSSSVSCTAATCTANDAGHYVECNGVRTYCLGVSISKSGSTLTANVIGGTSPYSYKWSYYRVCSGGGPVEPVAPGAPAEMREPCGYWFGPYSGGSTYTYSYTDRIYKVTVTDSGGRSASDEYGGLY
ncbi:MAG: hypothetical protein JXB05_23005 [Myxococcaceae bacterium]|nr:hypothetical protein [Myxococcaceae bacterium]